MHKNFKGYKRFNIVYVSAIILSVQLTNSKAVAQINDTDHKIRTIVIDAGHGGKDPGALGKKSKEKDIVLAVSLKAGKYIEERIPDVKVIYTRKSDVFPALHERSRIANEANADLFISIHANSNPNTRAYGSETYVLGLHKTEENLEVAKKENSVIVFEENYETQYEGFDPNDIESYIMFSLMQDTYLEQSLNAASFVQNQFRERAKRKDRGVKQAGFLVLWQTSMPSILIELGFVSNPKEEEYLMSAEGQDYLASAIYRAFRDYKEYIEGSASTNRLAASNENDNVVIPYARDSQPTQKAGNNLKDKAEEKSASTQQIEPTTIASDSILFKVQILYSENKLELSDHAFTDFNDVEEILINGRYKYLVGAKKNYNDAVEYSKWVKSRHPDAFVVAVSQGKIIPLSEAIEIVKKNQTQF
jgi:N-acetylmuramoyl-L-alanine amidase